MAGTPSFTVVPRHRLSCLARIWHGAAQRQSYGALGWAGVTPQHRASDHLWIFFLGLVSLPGVSGGPVGVTPAWSSRVVLVVLGGYGSARAGRPRRRAHRGGARWPRRGQRSLRWTGQAACRFGPTLEVGRRPPRLGECVTFHRRCGCTRCGAVRTEQDCSAHAGQVACPRFEV